MSSYVVVKGKESKTEGYLEKLKEKSEEHEIDLEIVEYEDIDEEFYRNITDRKAIILLGNIEDPEKLEDAAGSVPAVSDKEYENFQNLDFDNLVSEALYERVIDTPEKERALELKRYLEEAGKLGIIIHENPDPDAMSSAEALRELSESYGSEAEVLYSGKISHQENKVLKNEMELDLIPLEDIENLEEKLEIYDNLAMVDTAPTNTRILDKKDIEEKLSIVLDHHEGWEELLEHVDFSHVDTERGAVASIITDYYTLLDEEPTEKVATALCHGIRSDTGALNPAENTVHIKDIGSYHYLDKYINREKLENIIDIPMNVGTAATIMESLESIIEDSGEDTDLSNHNGTTIISKPGYVESADALSQSSDVIRHIEGLETVMVYGMVEDGRIFVKGRNTDPKKNLVEEFENIAEKFEHCSGGGKGGKKSKASLEFRPEALVRLPDDSNQDIDDFRDLIKNSFETLVRETYLEEI